MTDASGSLWILRPPRGQSKAERNATERSATQSQPPLLFCIPQAGMGAWTYHALAQQLAPDVEVLPVELPGHNSRMNREALQTDLRALAAQVAAVVRQCSQDRAYAVFGHSMGAWIAYEVVQELQQTGHALPLHLFVASNRAPSLCGASHDVDSTRLSQLTELEFWAALERRYGPNPALASPALRKAMWPVLKADFTLLETYQHDPGTPAVPCPLTVIAGSLDTRFTKDQVAAWQHHALAPGALFGAEFQEVWLEGQGHNFISQPPAQLVQLLRDALQ
ncbi:Alpha/Beta hydrolase protein [Haematococcus lacustris]